MKRRERVRTCDETKGGEEEGVRMWRKWREREVKRGEGVGEEREKRDKGRGKNIKGRRRRRICEKRDRGREKGK